MTTLASSIPFNALAIGFEEDLVKKNATATNELLDFLTMKGDTPMLDDDLKFISSTEHELRFSVVSELQNLSPSDQLELAKLTNIDQYPLAETMFVQYKINPVPPLQCIEQFNFELIAATVAEAQCDRLKATFFIFLDILNLREHGAVMVELIRDTPIQGLLEELVNGYNDRNWEQTAKDITNVWLALVSAEFVVRFVKTQVGNAVARKMFERASVILVPYLGWIYGTRWLSMTVRVGTWR